MDKPPPQASRIGVTDELPPQMERRLVLRLLAYWRSLGDGRAWPSAAAIDPAQIADLWPHCFVLELVGTAKEPVFRALGPEFARHAERPLVGCRASAVAPGSLVGAATAYIPAVLEKGVPISRGGVLRGPGAATLVYRSVLLPMSDDGAEISGILGAASCRDERQD
jgi:hypothetical protein